MFVTWIAQEKPSDLGKGCGELCFCFCEKKLKYTSDCLFSSQCSFMLYLPPGYGVPNFFLFVINTKIQVTVLLKGLLQLIHQFNGRKDCKFIHNFHSQHFITRYIPHLSTGTGCRPASTLADAFGLRVHLPLLLCSSRVIIYLQSYLCRNHP